MNRLRKFRHRYRCANIGRGGGSRSGWSRGLPRIYPPWLASITAFPLRHESRPQGSLAASDALRLSFAVFGDVLPQRSNKRGPLPRADFWSVAKSRMGIRVRGGGGDHSRGRRWSHDIFVDASAGRGPASAGGRDGGSAHLGCARSLAADDSRHTRRGATADGATGNQIACGSVSYLKFWGSPWRGSAGSYQAANTNPKLWSGTHGA
jgi:hypothetical protein